MLLDHRLGGFARSRLAAQRHTAHGPVLIFHSFLSSFFVQAFGPLVCGPAFSKTPGYVHFNFAAEDANKPELECQNVE